MKDVRLRALTLRDTERILEIDARVTGTPPRGSDNDLWRLIAETTTCFGAEVGGRLVGFVLADVRPWEFGNRAHVGWVIALGVDPAHQQKGIGRMLGERAVEEFRRLGVTQFKTLVDASDRDLLAYFGSLGFREAGEKVLALDVASGTRRASTPPATTPVRPTRTRARSR